MFGILRGAANKGEVYKNITRTDGVKTNKKDYRRGSLFRGKGRISIPEQTQKIILLERYCFTT